MRLAALAVLVVVAGNVDERERAPAPQRARLAGLAESVPKLFLDIVNSKLKGRIDPKRIRYDAPSSVVLEDAKLLDPRGGVVARVKGARATLSLSELLSGEIVVSRVELDAPNLDLVLHDKQLNLIEALTPRKPPEKKGDAKTAFRIDHISVAGGAFRFTDEENVTVTASGIAAGASLEIDLARDYVIVDVKGPRIAAGKVETKQVDVPIANIAARQVVVFKDRVDIHDASARAAGAAVTVAGSVHTPEPGQLSLHGFIDAPAGAWPEKLEPLPFPVPTVKGKVDVTGKFAEPRVAVDATFGATNAYGYAVAGGRGVVDVTPKLVRILDGTVVRPAGAGGGAVYADGSVTLPELQLDLKVRAAEVPLATALAPAKLEPAPRGSVSARATLRGVADGKAPITVEAHGTARRVVIAGVIPKGELDIDAKLVVKPEHVVLESATLSGGGLDGRVRGDIFTKEERIALTLTATAEDAARLVDEVPEEIKVGVAGFSGTVAGPYKTVRVEGEVNGVGADAFGVPVDDIQARLTASAQEVRLAGLSARAAGGKLSAAGDVVIALKGTKLITGMVRAEGVDLATIRATDGTELPLAGRADAEAVLAGPYNDPTVMVRAAAGGLAVSGEKLGSATARLKVTRKLLTVLEARVEGPLVDASTQELVMGLPELDMHGTVRVARVDLAQIAAAQSAELAGEGSGLVVINGDARQPTLTARLDVLGFAVGPQRLGDGPVVVGLAPDTPPLEGGERRHVVSVAAKLGSADGLIDVESAIAIQRRVIHAKARLTDVDLAPFTKHLGEQVAPLEGYTSGLVEAWGPLERLSMRARLRVPEVAVAPVRPADSAPVPEERKVPLLRPLGELVLDARMDEGDLAATLCAFQAARPAPGAAKGAAADGAGESPCDQPVRVWGNVVGSVDVLNGAFDIAVDGLVEEHALQDLVPAIARRGFEVGAKTRAAAQITRAKGQKGVDVAAQATLLQASVRPPGELRADLVGTAEVLYADQRVFLERPARFRAPSGEIDVAVGGAVGSDDIALDIEGTVALALAKVFTEQISNARGIAQTELSIRGRYADGVAIEGAVTPQPGAMVTPRALGQPVVFQEGALRFAPAANTDLLTVTADDVRAKLGDGDVLLRGSVDARTARKPDETWVERWNLTLNGAGLAFRMASGRVEGTADLALTGTAAAPVLRGRVELTDGSYKKSLELRNFVLEAPKGRPSDPLWVTLTPIGLGNLELDVALALQNFRVRANVANFDADMMLRGSLKVNKLLRLPVIDGAVEVEEGQIAFPRARFDIVEMQVEFPSTGDGRINPLVHLTAHTEIPPGGAGDNDTEVPVDLFLDGSMEGGMNLDLVATDPTREWSRSDLLGVIVFGKSLEQTVESRDVSLALRALLNEASAPLTEELEQLAQQTLGVDVEIAATSWRWQLGRRLQVEGDVVLVDDQSQQSATPGAVAAPTSSSTQNDTWRLRLIILDHLPFGRSLSVESRNSTLNGTDLRFTLRVFEE